MAISDVLFEAAEEIRRYMRELPTAYISIKPEIDDLLNDMDAIRAGLDTVPEERNTP